MKLLGAVTPLMALAAFGQTTPNYTSPLGVDIYNPGQLFNASGPWSMMSRAGNTLYVSGMRGFYPSNTTLAPVGYDRVHQAFSNMKQLAELGGSDLASHPSSIVLFRPSYHVPVRLPSPIGLDVVREAASVRDGHVPLAAGGEPGPGGAVEGRGAQLPTPNDLRSTEAQ